MKHQTLLSWLPFLLLAAIIIYDCYSFYNLNYRVQFMLEKSVQVVQYAREIRTRLSEMHNIMPGLLSRSDLRYAEVVEILNEQEEKQNNAIAKMGDLFAGNQEIMQSLVKGFHNVNLLGRQISHLLVGNDNYQRSLNLFNEILSPEVKKLTVNLDDIIKDASGRMEQLHQRSSREALICSIITLLSGFLVGVIFYWILRRDRQITMQLKDRDRVFTQISRNVDEIFIVASSASNFNYSTTNSQRIIGLPASEILDNPETLYKFLPPDIAEWLKTNLSQSLMETARGELQIVTDLGTQALRIGIHPYEYEEEKRAIISIEDTTDIFRKQQALETALDAAHSASNAKSSFLSHMSHEIRTPMNAIIGMTTIALSKLGDISRVENCLLKISESSRHLLRLINDVLDMSKIENGKLSINNESFALADVVRNISDLILPQAESRKLEFEIKQEKVETEILVGDSLRLNQILLNILSNSLKFTPQEGKITLVIKQLERSGNNVRLSFRISDTGIGMNQEALDRLYLPFEQASSGTAMRYGGTGLGMSITYNLVLLMGGAIDVKSEEGKGTTFTIELPFGCLDTEIAESGSLAPLKILIVDDDRGTCEHAALLLEKMGMEVQWCTTGKAAIEMVKKAMEMDAAYNVCFIDWRMPEMDGAETASRIREIAGKDILIIIITAYDCSHLEKKAGELGVDDFLPKPFFASTLYNSILTSSQKLGEQKQQLENCESEKLNFTGKRVLLVEDNEFNREIANEFLQMVYIEVDNAENGKEAVDKFLSAPQGRYDLILMDVQMPVMNGYDAARKIRSSAHPDASNIPILAMTANAFSDDIMQAKNSGMNDHIAKPIDIDFLYKKLDEWFKKTK